MWFIFQQILFSAFSVKQSLRSRHRRCFVRTGILRNFAKLTRKHLCQCLIFDRVPGLRPVTLLKKRLWNSRFPLAICLTYHFIGKSFVEHTQLAIKPFYQSDIPLFQIINLSDTLLSLSLTLIRHRNLLFI